MGPVQKRLGAHAETPGNYALELDLKLESEFVESEEIHLGGRHRC